MSDAVNLGVRQRRGLRAEGFGVAKRHSQLDSAVPTISSGSGAPSHSAPDSSLYMRDDGSSGSILYVMVGGSWTAIAATAVSGTDFGSGGIATDVIAESTAAAGVTIDGLLIKDERIQVTGAGISTGDAGITLKDNLASAWDYKEGSNVYLRLCTTNSSEAVQAFQRLTTTDGVASGTARIVGGIADSDPAASTAVTGATETITNFDTAEYTLPAASLKVGTMVRIRAGGIYTATTGTENHIFAVRAGSTTIGATGNIDPATNDVFDIEFTFVCRATGASGTIVGSGVCRSGPRATASPATHLMATGSAATSTTTVDTTGSLVLAVAVDRQATATDGDSMRLDWFTVEVIG